MMTIRHFSCFLLVGSIPARHKPGDKGRAGARVRRATIDYTLGALCSSCSFLEYLNAHTPGYSLIDKLSSPLERHVLQSCRKASKVCALRGQFLGELIQCNDLFNKLTEALPQAAGLDLVSEALRAVELFAQMKNTLTKT
jgi:hypothetical protein